MSLSYLFTFIVFKFFIAGLFLVFWRSAVPRRFDWLFSTVSVVPAMGCVYVAYVAGQHGVPQQWLISWIAAFLSGQLVAASVSRHLAKKATSQ